MHAALLGRELGVKEVIVPLYPGLFSAWGMLASEPRRDFVRTRLTLDADMTVATLTALFDELRAEAIASFRRDADSWGDGRDVAMRLSCDLRYFGQEHAVTVTIDLDGATIPGILADFHDEHERTYTFRLDGAKVEFVTFRLRAHAVVPRPELPMLDPAGRSAEAARKGSRMVDFGEDGRHSAAIYERDLLPADFTTAGPVLLEEATSITMVMPGQILRVDERGILRIREAAA
jgi:N-methylhydantoinase A